MAGLTAGLSAGGRWLGRARGCGGRVRRGRARGVGSVLVEARLELADLGRESGKLGLEVGDESLKLGDLGLKCVTARTLGVRRAHTPVVRESAREVLPT